MSTPPPPMNNQVTRLCKIKYPIFMGGMVYIASPKLVSSVSNAGGCGILASLARPSPNALRQAIQETRSLIKNNLPFGVNISFVTDKQYMASTYKQYDLYTYNKMMAQVIIDEGVKIVETTHSTTNANETIKNIICTFKKAKPDIIIIHKCHSIENAITAVQYGADIISLDSFESGGHHGRYDISNLVLLPLAKKVLKNIPIIVSGGIVNGLQMASMFVMGAEGVKLGTRFCATNESDIDIKCKLTMLGINNENGTIMAYRNNLPTSMRVYNSKKAKEVCDYNENGNGGNDDKKSYKYMFSIKDGMIDGKVNDYLWSVGEGVCLIDDIISCKQVIETMVKECRDNIRMRAKL